MEIIGAALADPSRSRMLCELMDGRAYTNKELACAAEITAQTASAHLKQLQQAGMTVSLRSGRHVYHRLANEQVAVVLESIASLSPVDHLQRLRGSKAKNALVARCCYNHLAGKLGVLLKSSLIRLDVLRITDTETLVLSPGGLDRLRSSGLAIPDPFPRGRPVAKPCLDWTERKHHISGPLATTLLNAFLEMNWLHREPGSRALALTKQGYSGFESVFAIKPSDITLDH